MKRILFILSIAFLSLSSCKSYKKIVYFQEAGQSISLAESQQDILPEPIIKNGDLLLITVNTESPDAALPFNPTLIPEITELKGSLVKTTTMATPQTYLVDGNGEIPFPIVGKLKVGGLTRSQLELFVKEQIYPRFLKENPMVVAKIINFNVSIMGEVARPGSIQVNNERITITSAIAQAGDLTIYGRRDNILLIREDQKGKRTGYRIDLTDKNLINSPFYFLQQNDVLYIEPNKTKSRTSVIGSAETLSFTIVGTLISIISLIATLTR